MAAPLPYCGAFAAELDATAAALVARGKGLLAADESTATAGKRLASVGVANSEEARRALRQMLLTAPALGAHISGVVRFPVPPFSRVRVFCVSRRLLRSCVALANACAPSRRLAPR
jgi:hypothetical protein